MAKPRLKLYGDGTATVKNGRRESSPFTWTPDYLTASEMHDYQIEHVVWAAVEVGVTMTEEAARQLRRISE